MTDDYESWPEMVGRRMQERGACPSCGHALQAHGDYYCTAPDCRCGGPAPTDEDP